MEESKKFDQGLLGLGAWGRFSPLRLQSANSAVRELNWCGGMFQAVGVRRWSRVFLLFLAPVSLLAWLAEQMEISISDADIQYNLGLVGGLMMASLLLYPVRKRFFPHDRMGSLEKWFRYHMVLGLLSPVLILFHARFEASSLNGKFALYSMLAVVLSGVVGRFIRRNVHRGLYGKHMTLEEVFSDLQGSLDNLGPLLTAVPQIAGRLEGFRLFAFDGSASKLYRAGRFFVLPLLGWQTSRQVARDLEIHRKMAARQSDELLPDVGQARALIDSYVKAVVKAARFSVYERLFSLWAAVHIPFLYLLVFSGIVHVIAVHMY